MHVLSARSFTLASLGLAICAAAVPANWPTLTSALSRADQMWSTAEAQLSDQLISLSSADTHLSSQFNSAQAAFNSQINVQIGSQISDYQSAVSSISSYLDSLCNSKTPSWFCFGTGP
ncbi:hypothetical protein DL89DRAFT_270960 [Linderina pennispora]|uniref:Uncharacterized protein n=1 Tax=Linderina pennispora TaxID=61395 RepID=A0A1Y1VVW1_9FUNG|nr:uncharacterized protein DL89DRAFT_270960 [Linderina pennispora]ORX65421.1 hypothetical protein DL89DRAFT_270960 [Linderina pennispora]